MRPCKLGEMLELSVILEKIGTSSISLRFDGHVNGELRLQAKSVLVVISLKTGKAEPISDDLRTRLSWFAPESGS